jgi:pyruvate kinase
MVRIAGEIERNAALDEGPKYDLPPLRHLRAGATPTEHAIAAATAEAVRLLGAPAIISLTRSGTTTRLVSSYRPPVPILGVSDQQRTWRQLALVWGVLPVYCEGDANYENMLNCARAYLIENRIASPGQRVVVTAGVPFHVRGTTNMLRVEEV